MTRRTRYERILSYIRCLSSGSRALYWFSQIIHFSPIRFSTHFQDLWTCRVVVFRLNSVSIIMIVSLFKQGDKRRHLHSSVKVSRSEMHQKRRKNNEKYEDSMCKSKSHSIWFISFELSWSEKKIEKIGQRVKDYTVITVQKLCSETALTMIHFGLLTHLTTTVKLNLSSKSVRENDGDVGIVSVTRVIVSSNSSSLSFFA